MKNRSFRSRESTNRNTFLIGMDEISRLPPRGVCLGRAVSRRRRGSFVGHCPHASARPAQTRVGVTAHSPCPGWKATLLPTCCDN